MHLGLGFAAVLAALTAGCETAPAAPPQATVERTETAPACTEAGMRDLAAKVTRIEQQCFFGTEADPRGD